MAKKEKLITALIAVISVGLAAAAYLILPDTVAMQVSTGGTLQNMMPKSIAVLLPLLITAVGLVCAVRAEEKTRCFLIAAIGPVLQVVTMFMNIAK